MKEAKMPNVIRASTIPEYVYDAYNTQSKRRGFPASYFLLLTSYFFCPVAKQKKAKRTSFDITK